MFWPQVWAIFAVGECHGISSPDSPACACHVRLSCCTDAARADAERPSLFLQKGLGSPCGCVCVAVPKVWVRLLADGNFCLQLSLRKSQRLKVCPFLWPVSNYCLVSSFLSLIIIMRADYSEKYWCLVSDLCLCTLLTRSFWVIILETLETLVLAGFFSSFRVA